MTRSEALEKAIHYKNIYHSICEDGEGFWTAVIDALKPEPCEDVISREDALMALTGEWTESNDELIHRFIRCIKNLSPVTPQPKTLYCPNCGLKWRE